MWFSSIALRRHDGQSTSSCNKLAERSCQSRVPPPNGQIRNHYRETKNLLQAATNAVIKFPIVTRRSAEMTFDALQTSPPPPGRHRHCRRGALLSLNVSQLINKTRFKLYVDRRIHKHAKWNAWQKQPIETCDGKHRCSSAHILGQNSVGMHQCTGVGYKSFQSNTKFEPLR